MSNEKNLLIEWISLIEQIESTTLLDLNVEELEKKYSLALLKIADELAEI